MTRAVDRMTILVRVVDYLIGGLERLHVSTLPGEMWLSPVLRLRQGVYAQGYDDYRILYSVPSMFSSDVNPVVRSVRWHRARDRERCKLGPIIGPEIESRYSTVPDSVLPILDRNIKSLQAELGRLPVEPVGLGRDLSGSHIKAIESPPPGGQISKSPVYRRSLWLTGVPVGLEVRFLSGSIHALDAKWDLIWQDLSTESNLAQISEAYPLDPQGYGSALMRALEAASG
jgi:hypothetical protein